MVLLKRAAFCGNNCENVGIILRIIGEFPERIIGEFKSIIDLSLSYNKCELSWASLWKLLYLDKAKESCTKIAIASHAQLFGSLITYNCIAWYIYEECIPVYALCYDHILFQPSKFSFSI